MSSYPLIIIGAGASHDYSDSEIKPPTTRLLVSRANLDQELIKKYPEVSMLLSQIQSAVNVHGKEFEAALFEVNKRAGHLPATRAQLIALQFYLQEFFEKVSQRFDKINNYKNLLQHITSYSNGKACIVSFNYDSLFEDSIIGNYSGHMNDYINNDLKLIKLHGSHNWSYIFNRDTISSIKEYENGYNYLKEFPDTLSMYRIKGYEPYHTEQIKKEIGRHDKRFFTFPALAIPLPAKEDAIICPKKHVEALKRELSLIDRVLIIGWRAADTFLLQLIKDHVRAGTKFTIVSKQQESANEIATNIAKFTNLQGSPIGGGFRHFIEHDTCHNFFSEKV